MLRLVGGESGGGRIGRTIAGWWAKRGFAGGGAEGEHLPLEGEREGCEEVEEEVGREEHGSDGAR